MKFEISVLLPVKNGAKYLEKAIVSILNQSFTNFEFIIINDGSTDNTENIISQFKDSRIITINNKSSIGIAKSLNKGLKISTGKYIARMDSDDFSLCHRFETQLKIFKEHQSLDILGTGIKIMNDYGQFFIKQVVESFEELKIELLSHCCLCHPSIMIKKSALSDKKLNYNPSVLHAEDYMLWVEAVINGLTIMNTPEVLLEYKLHEEQISSKNRAEQEYYANLVRITFAKHVFKEVINGKEILFLKLLHPENYSLNNSDYSSLERLADALKIYNNKVNFFKNDIFQSYIDNKVSVFSHNKLD